MKSCIVTTLFRAAIPFMLAVSMLDTPPWLANWRAQRCLTR